MEDTRVKRHKVLVVDDDQGILKLYDVELREEGYEVVLASDGEEGLARFRKDSPDLVILDLNMPKRNGISLLNIILGMDRQAKVIINSAYPQFQDNFMTWGAEAYILKSADFRELKRKIKDALGKGKSKDESCKLAEVA